MVEIIEFPVVIKGEKEGRLMLSLNVEANVLDVYLDNKELFACDWDGNALQVFEKMLKTYKKVNKEQEVESDEK